MTPDDPQQPQSSDDAREQPAVGAPVLTYAGVAEPLRMATVATYGDVSEAHLACGALERAGINAVLDGENLAANVQGYAPVLGALKLRVEAQHLACARQVLDDIAAKRTKRSRYESDACPACQSRRIHRMTRRRTAGIALLMVGLAGCAFAETRPMALMLVIVAGYVLITPEYARYQCDACRHRWHPPELEEDENDNADDDDEQSAEDRR